MNTIRAFIAIELPPDILTRLTEIQTQLKASLPAGSVRWVRAQGIHLTLKFLGDVPTTQVDSIKSAMAHTAGELAPFTFSVGQSGCFPNASRPRVIWVGIQEPGGNLSRLQRAIESAIAPLGYPTEKRPFHPHLTLGRVARDVNSNTLRNLGNSVVSAQIGTLGQVAVRDVALVQSHLKPSGAEYTTLMRAPLKPTED